VSGLSVGPSGEAYAALEPAGPAGELQLRVTPGVWSFGIGGQRSRHGSSEEGVGDQPIVLQGVLVQPRGIVDVTAKDCGAQLNAGGVLVRLSARVNLDVGDTFGIMGFGVVLVDVPGAGRTTVGGSSGTGQNLVLRAGVAIGLGGKAYGGLPKKECAHGACLKTHAQQDRHRREPTLSARGRHAHRVQSQFDEVVTAPHGNNFAHADIETRCLRIGVARRTAVKPVPADPTYAVRFKFPLMTPRGGVQRDGAEHNWAQRIGGLPAAVSRIHALSGDAHGDAGGAHPHTGFHRDAVPHRLAEYARWNSRPGGDGRSDRPLRRCPLRR